MVLTSELEEITERTLELFASIMSDSKVKPSKIQTKFEPKEEKDLFGDAADICFEKKDYERALALWLVHKEQDTISNAGRILLNRNLLEPAISYFESIDHSEGLKQIVFAAQTIGMIGPMEHAAKLIGYKLTDNDYVQLQNGAIRYARLDDYLLTCSRRHVRPNTEELIDLGNSANSLSLRERAYVLALRHSDKTNREKVIVALRTLRDSYVSNGHLDSYLKINKLINDPNSVADLIEIGTHSEGTVSERAYNLAISAANSRQEIIQVLNAVSSIPLVQESAFQKALGIADSAQDYIEIGKVLTDREQRTLVYVRAIDETEEVDTLFTIRANSEGLGTIQAKALEKILGLTTTVDGNLSIAQRLTENNEREQAYLNAIWCADNVTLILNVLQNAEEFSNVRKRAIDKAMGIAVDANDYIAIAQNTYNTQIRERAYTLAFKGRPKEGEFDRLSILENLVGVANEYIGDDRLGDAERVLNFVRRNSRPEELSELKEKIQDSYNDLGQKHFIAPGEHKHFVAERMVYHWKKALDMIRVGYNIGSSPVKAMQMATGILSVAVESDDVISRLICKHIAVGCYNIADPSGKLGYFANKNI